MLRNYIKIVFRNLARNKVSSFINVFGLSIAVGCSITVYLFLHLVYTSDNFHENVDNIFLVESIIGEEDNQQMWCNTPKPLGPALKADFAQVENAARIAYGNGTVRFGEKVFNEGFWYVDPAFTEIFSFPMKYGNPAALENENGVIFSEDMAIKYFGQSNPIGEEITITFGELYQETFVVEAVADDFPRNASLDFRMLLNYEKQRDIGIDDLDEWAVTTAATFVLVNQPQDIETVANQMNRYVAVQNAVNDDWHVSGYSVENLSSVARNAYKKRNAISGIGHPAGRILLVLIALFLLTLSCFNYMNIALATVTRRLKEIGIRKTVGGNKGQLIRQFLFENVIICLFALLLGLGFAHFFLAPTFNNMFVGSELLKISFLDHAGLWIFLFSLLVLVGLASGAYPAFFISSFKPASILKGTFRINKKQRFTRTLLGFQFTLAFISMITGIILSQNATYQNELDWGYNEDGIIVVRLEGGQQYTMLRNDILQNPDILSVAGSKHHVGTWNDMVMVDIKGESMEVERFDVGFGYLEALQIRLKEGRLFDRNHTSDRDRAIVINETFARQQGWSDPVGRTVRFDSTKFSVIGVVENFHYTAFHSQIEPVLFRIVDESAFSHMTVRTKTGTEAKTTAHLEETWKSYLPDIPYDGFYQNTVFDSLLIENVNIGKVFRFMAVVTLIISSMGLFGLSSQNTARRMKEISIRKVMGARISGLTSQINRGFVLIILISAVVATPVSYLAIDALLKAIYKYYISITMMPFVISYVFVLLTAGLTISLQLYRVIVSNPAEVLRNE